MKKLYLIGNHKMNLSKADLIPYLKGIKKFASKTGNVVGVAVATPYIYLAEKFLRKSDVLYGAQDCHYEKKGAFTSEISSVMLKDFGCKMSIVGHSECRAYNGDTNEIINRKIKALLKDNLRPIFCIGETKEERDSDLTKKVIKTQLEEGLKDLTKDEVKKIFFAYEPVWAIGTGVNATSKQAEDIAKYIKQYIGKLFDTTNGEIVLLYGGSLNPSNAVELLSNPNIDGGLIGGASLKLDTFEKLINLKIDED